MRSATAGFSARIERKACSVMTITRAGDVVRTVALRDRLGHDAHLAQEVARTELRHPLAVSHHLRGAVLEHEELVRELPLADELGALRTSSSSACWRDGAAFVARQRVEQRHRP